MSRYKDFLFYCLILSIPVLFMLGSRLYQAHLPAPTKSSPKVQISKAKITPTPTLFQGVMHPSAKKNKKSTISSVLAGSNSQSVSVTPAVNNQNQPVASTQQNAASTPTVFQPQPTSQPVQPEPTQAPNGQVEGNAPHNEAKAAPALLSETVNAITHLLPL